MPNCKVKYLDAKGVMQKMKVSVPKGTDLSNVTVPGAGEVILVQNRDTGEVWRPTKAAKKAVKKKAVKKAAPVKKAAKKKTSKKKAKKKR